MMKVNFSKKLLLGAATLTGVVVFASSVAFAQQKPVKNFCTDLPAISMKITSRLDELQGQLESERTARGQRLTESRAARTAERTQNRTQVDALRAGQIGALEASAKTDTQDKAIAAFKTSVASAIAVRRGAADAAVGTFERGVDQAITSRKGSVDSAVITFKTSVVSVISQATAACGRVNDAITLHRDFVDGLRRVREKMEADRLAIEKVQIPVDALLMARHNAINKAEADFAAAIIKAHAALKVGFGEPLSN